MSTPTRVTRSKKGKDREISTPSPAQTISKAKLGKHQLSSHASRRLRCLIEGEPPVFLVSLPSDSDIGDLKELVHEKGINAAERTILAKDLELLKVSCIP
jgi:Crinkler effector protein N-terminal domain